MIILNAKSVKANHSRCITFFFIDGEGTKVTACIGCQKKPWPSPTNSACVAGLVENLLGYMAQKSVAEQFPN